MRNSAHFTSLAIIIFCWLGYAGVSAHANTPLPTPTPLPLNTIKIGIGQCRTRDEIERLIAAERARALVMDARPFAINQSTGKLAFNGSTGRVSIVNTNPFVYTYRITVSQEELVSTALTDFLKLLLPDSLRSNVGLQSGGFDRSAAKITPPSKLNQIAKRLETFDPAKCGNTAACVAVGEMYKVFTEIRERELTRQSGVEGKNAEELLFTPKDRNRNSNLISVNTTFATYTEYLNELRDEEADAYKVCNDATNLNLYLAGLKQELKKYLEAIDTARRNISEINVLATDLEDMVKAFNADEDLKKEGKAIRCRGFSCVDQFETYAQTVRGILGTYSTELTKLEKNAKEMQNMYLLTEQLKGKEGLFARTFTIIKKFELSQATVALNRTKLRQQEGGSTDKTTAGIESGNPDTTGSDEREPQETGGESSEGSGSVNSLRNSFMANSGRSETSDSNAASSRKESGKESGKDANPPPAGQIKDVIQIGRPRFALSGGLVYSPLPRRTFKSVKGFALDAQGNPTGKGDANVVGYDENSSRRLLPMVLLNTRLLSYEPASLYFSFGVSAKNDDNVDIEYLFGPSIGLLNDRALFTFGAYGGKTQNLVSDVKVGDALPDDIGDAKLFRKSYTWKPGFSFSYSFSRTQKRSVEGGTEGGGSTSDADELQNEIRIGNIPFNLALGLAYTSLEQRTYDEIVGLARDRQGNLTNGQTLTRIVGLTSSSSYRLTPVALLHSRLTNFGKYDFYFSTGVTGKKTDNAFDIEYLLGGSVNLYQRKVFLTFGAFVGKQQILGGDFFEGSKIGQSQSVTTQNRYVWKPAISFSYDISRIIPRRQ